MDTLIRKSTSNIREERIALTINSLMKILDEKGLAFVERHHDTTSIYDSYVGYDNKTYLDMDKKVELRLAEEDFDKVISIFKENGFYVTRTNSTNLKIEG